MICDAQVHAPDLPHAGRAHGMDPEELVSAMDGAAVQRALIVPLAGPGETVDNGPALRIAARRSDRFAVIGLVDLLDPPAALAALRTWRDTPHLLGVRIPFIRASYRSLLVERKLGWFWEAAETAGIPVMVNAPGALDAVAEIASAHGRLRLAIDHFGLEPYVTYDRDGLLRTVEGTLSLARYENVSVKATALTCSVAEPYPFPSLHEPIRRVVSAFGGRRVFWGSDITRLTVPYTEAVRLFTEALPFLSEDDLRWIMGRAVCAWTGWPVDQEGRWQQ